MGTYRVLGLFRGYVRSRVGSSAAVVSLDGPVEPHVCAVCSEGSTISQTVE